MVYQAGYVEGLFTDDSRLDWDNSAPRPVRWSCWYPADIGSPISEHRFGGTLEQPLFTGGLIAPNASISTANKTWPLVVLSHGTGG